MKRGAFLFTLFFTLVSACNCVSQVNRKLEQNEFDTDILNQWWSFEDKAAKGECDMRILIVKTKEFEMNCVNWANGFSGSKCTYSLTIKNDLIELAPGNCEKSANPGYVYGYLSDASLFLLISGKRLEMTPELLKEKSWFKFDKIKK